MWRAGRQDTHALPIQARHLHLSLHATGCMIWGPEALQVSVAVEDVQDPHMRVLLQPIQASYGDVWPAEEWRIERLAVSALLHWCGRLMNVDGL